MMYLMMQALTELAVLYPVNGAFYTYIVRFIDPSWYVRFASFCSLLFVGSWRADRTPGVLQ